MAALSGDVCIDRLRAGGVTLIDTYPSYQSLIAAAVAGGPKIFCMDGPSAEYYLYKANASQRFREAFVMYYGHMHRAVRRGDAATLALIEKGFDQISPAEKKALEDKWFGAPLAGARWLRVLIVAARRCWRWRPSSPCCGAWCCGARCATRPPRSTARRGACAR